MASYMTPPCLLWAFIKVVSYVTPPIVFWGIQQRLVFLVFILTVQILLMAFLGSPAGLRRCYLTFTHWFSSSVDAGVSREWIERARIHFAFSFASYMSPYWTAGGAATVFINSAQFFRNWLTILKINIFLNVTYIFFYNPWKLHEMNERLSAQSHS